MANDLRFVVATPGRVAYMTPAAKKKFTSMPTQVPWNSYLEELLSVHGDIQVVDPAAYLASQKKAKAAPAKTVAPAVAEKKEEAVRPLDAKEAPLKADNAPVARPPSSQS